MSRWTLVLTILILWLIFIGCSGNSSAPLLPDTDPLAVSVPAENRHDSQTHLWGFFEIQIDLPTESIQVIPARGLLFTANVVNFINSNPANLEFIINDISPGSGYTDIDIDVTVVHPFPGMPEYRGYDVRGVFMGDGSGSLETGNAVFSVNGADQFMLPDPVGGIGGPDGYTRWFNFTEFSEGGMPLFQYTDGIYTSPGFSGTATINPYKYYADSLSVNEDLWTWLNDHPDQNGIFSSGASNTRNYYLRFPDDTGVVYGYAIIANWEGSEPEYHPSNAHEAVALNVANNSTVYYVDPVQNGGNLDLDISVWDWDSEISAGVMEDYKIIIESPVLSGPYVSDTSDMTPVGGDENFSTYHVEVPADNVQGPDESEYWVIVEEQVNDYTNEFGVPNLADTDQLSAFFRYSLTIGTGSPAWIEITIPNGGEQWTPGDDEDITWSYDGLTGNVLIEYSMDNFVSDVNEIATGIPIADGTYLWTVACDPSDNVRVRVSSIDTPTVSDNSDEDFSIINSGWALKYGDAYYDEGRRVAFDPDGNVYLAGTHRPAPGSRNYGFVAKYTPCGELLWHKYWGGTGHTQGYGVAVDDDGNAYITGNFYGTTDFDPDDLGGPNQITSVATWDVWLNVFDTNGAHQWVRTWGGGYSDTGRGVAVDDLGDVYVGGHFSLTVNFDPYGTDERTSNGDFDCFLTKFDSSGNHQWVKAWGGSGEDRGRDVAAGGGNVYMTGFFHGTNINFNPDGSQLISSNGGMDIYLTAFNTDGTFQWAYGWGGTSTGIGTDEGLGVAADSSGNAYASGSFWGSNVNFNPTGSDPHSSNGARDAYVSKFNVSGGFEWARTWGDWTHDAGMGVAVDSSGNVYTTGYFWNDTDLNPDGGDPYTAIGWIDCFISKIDSSGSYQWGRIWGSAGSTQDRGFGVGCDNSDNIYATGFFSGLTDFAPGEAPCNEPPDEITPTGNADAFLIKYLPPDGCW